MQVSCRVHTEVQEEKAVRTDKAGAGARAKAAGGAERKQGAGGTHDDGSRPHADGDTAEAQRVADGRVHKGKKRDMDSACVRREAEVFQRPAYAGEGIFRVQWVLTRRSSGNTSRTKRMTTEGRTSCLTSRKA